MSSSCFRKLLFIQQKKAKVKMKMKAFNAIEINKLKGTRQKKTV